MSDSVCKCVCSVCMVDMHMVYVYISICVVLGIKIQHLLHASVPSL